MPQKTDYRPYGSTPGAERLAREATRLRSALDDQQPEVAEVTIAASSTMDVPHGFRATPSLVTVTPITAPASYAVTARNERIVTVENGAGTEIVFLVAIYR